MRHSVSVSVRFVLFYLSSLRWRVCLGASTIVIAIASGCATFLVLTGKTSLTPTYNVVVTVLVGNAILVFLLSLLIASELMRLWFASRVGDAGAWLQGRVVSIFAFISTVPALIVAVIASITLDMGLDHWFSDRTQAMIRSSTSIAYAYMREHTNAIRRDMLAIGTTLDQSSLLLDRNHKKFSNILHEEMIHHSLTGIYIIDNRYRIIVKHTKAADDYFLIPPAFALRRANEGEAVILTPGLNDQAAEIGALIKLKSYKDAYLYVVRRLDQKVVWHIRETAGQAIEYQSLKKRRNGVQIAFALMYADIVLTLLFAAIWTALWFSNRLIAPIRRLISAARLVAGGNLDVQVEVRQEDGELANLGETFNSMIRQLNAQRDELLRTNFALDNRSRFTEAVLAGVTSGVIGIDRNGSVELINRSAEMFLKIQSDGVIGFPLEQEIPELCDILQAALSREQRLHQGQIMLSRGGQECTVIVRVTSQGDRSGYVVTLDDITELVTAQRAFAWRDIARRIAHEMKNPLTPIQLSAERLRRRYGQMIIDDRQVFDRCIDTIIRQVGDIERMVDEFSAFARMPKAVMEEVDIITAVQEAIFLFSVSHPEIKIYTINTEIRVLCICDRRLISQMITNLVKNASEAISAIQYDDNETPWIEMRVEVDEQNISLLITDNGCGLPLENRQQLLEPYMTRSAKGTGLGLAIVRKIVEEHCGRIVLSDAPQVANGGHGAQVMVVLPRSDRRL